MPFLDLLPSKWLKIRKTYKNFYILSCPSTVLKHYRFYNIIKRHKEWAEKFELKMKIVCVYVCKYLKMNFLLLNFLSRFVFLLQSEMRKKLYLSKKIEV